MNQSSPPQKPTIEERLTDAVIKLVVAGSGGYALYNLYIDDLPKAAIAGSISIVSTLLTKFGEGLTSSLGDRMKERGESSGNIVNEAIDTTVDKTLTRLTGFHQQYLEALKTHCHNLKVEGYKGRLPRLVLEEVYVPLRVHSGSQSLVSLQKRNLKIWDLLPKTHHPDRAFPQRLLAVIADPGYGKTTLMRFLTLCFSNQTHTEHGAKELIPILLLFRNCYQRIQSPTEPSLPQLIVEQVQKLPCCADLRASEPWFKEQLVKGKCLVMLDGMDEIPEPQREMVSQWANWQMQNYPTQFILTSRPHGYDSSLFEGVQRLDILDFNNDQKRTFIDQWYRFITWELTWKPHWEESRYNPDPQKRLSREQVEAESETEAKAAAADLSRQLFADQSLTNLAKNPLLITIIAATHEANENLPTRRVYLYREIFKLLLEYRPNRRDTRLTIASAEDNQRILQQLALKLTETGKTQFSSDEGSQWIKVCLAEVCPDGSLTPKQFLREIQQVAGLLAGGESNLYEFTHKTFQEYLAAVELSQSQWGQRKVMAQFANENWKEVVYFYATLTDPVPFIEAALADGRNTYTLELAQRLANESTQMDTDLKIRLLDTQQKLAPKSAKIRLQKRFKSLIKLSEDTEISGCITRGEYEIFYHDDNAKSFESPEKSIMLRSEDISSSKTGDTTWQEAQCFCAWLSTQPHLAPDDGVYHYRLPTLDEIHLVSQSELNSQSSDTIIDPDIPWTNDPNLPGNVVRVVRQRIPDRYRELVNYLANGRWKEADQETYELMLSIAGKEAKQRRYLRLDEIKNFPCGDLLIIDQLWVKFSGGKFGFSVQKQIWVDVGGKLDFGEDEDAAWEAFERMSDRNGWKARKYDYSKVTFDTSAKRGHLPYVRFKKGSVFSSLASRLVNCNT